MTSVYKQALKDWVATLEVKAGRVLDIGASQDPIKGRTKSWDVDEYLLSDLPIPHQGVKPDITFDLNREWFSGQDFDDVKYQEYFDLIFCLEVFDYIWDPVEAFDSLHRFLKAGGEAWVSFPFIYPVHNPVEDDALRYTEPGIRRFANEVGLSVEEVIYRRPQSHKLLEYYAEDGFRAAPGVDHAVIGYIVRFRKEGSSKPT